MKCERCGADTSEGSRFCSQCGAALTEDVRKAMQEALARAVQNTTTPVINPNTFAGYLQTDAGKDAFKETLDFFKQWVSETARGFRLSLWIFAIVLVVSIGAVVWLGLTHTLTSSVATVLGVLIGYVLAKMPGPGGGSSSSQ